MTLRADESVHEQSSAGDAATPESGAAGEQYSVGIDARGLNGEHGCEHDERDEKQHVIDAPKRVRTQHAEEPEEQEKNDDRFEHGKSP